MRGVMTAPDVAPFGCYVSTMYRLAHSIVTPRGGEPRKAMLFLHGILGRGNNWRSFARRMVDDREGFAAVLVDLRHHGDSLDVRGGEDSIEGCVDDLEALEGALGLPVAAALGHSFGGKVALAYAARRRAPLEEALIVDVDPAANLSRGRPEVESLIETLETLPKTHPSREAFAEALAERGVGKTLSGWLSLNLSRDEDGVRFGPDLGAIRAMLRSHLETDLMDAALKPREGTRMRFLLGGRSDSVSPESRRALEEAAARGVIELEIAPDAGHWVHVDAPETMRRFLNGQRA